MIAAPVFVVFAAFLLLIYGHRLSMATYRLQKSGVRTDTLDMVRDHDSGQMEGRCLKGQSAGRALSSLRDEEVLRLLDELKPQTPKARRCRGFLAICEFTRLSVK